MSLVNLLIYFIFGCSNNLVGHWLYCFDFYSMNFILYCFFLNFLKHGILLIYCHRLNLI